MTWTNSPVSESLQLPRIIINGPQGKWGDEAVRLYKCVHGPRLSAYLGRSTSVGELNVNHHSQLLDWCPRLLEIMVCWNDTQFS
jgi:hypothetical protein